MRSEQNNSGHTESGGGRVNINNQALAYMEAKYGEPFTYVGAAGDSLSDTHKLLVSCQSMPEKKVLVEIEQFRSENPVFMDNLLAVKYEQKTRDFLLECAVHVYGEADVFYTATEEGQSPKLSGDASFSEFLADTRVPLIAAIEIKDSSRTSDTQSEELGRLLSASGANIYITLVAVDDNEFGTLDREALNEKRGSNYCVRISNLDGNIQIKKA